MEIEVLHIDHCPNWRQTGELIVRALADLGAADVPVRYTLISTPEQAMARPFAGSPTVLIDGIDAFPSDGQTADLACRVYLTDGRLAGSPSASDLRAALAAALSTR